MGRLSWCASSATTTALAAGVRPEIARGVPGAGPANAPAAARILACSRSGWSREWRSAMEFYGKVANDKSNYQRSDFVTPDKTIPRRRWLGNFFVGHGFSEWKSGGIKVYLQGYGYARPTHNSTGGRLRCALPPKHPAGIESPKAGPVKPLDSPY